MSSALILGAGSDVGLACADEFAGNGYNIQLAGRRSERFAPLCSDLQIRYNITATAHEFDADQYDTHQNFVAHLPAQPDVVICMFGYLGEQEKAQSDWKECARIISANYTGAVSILNLFADQMAKAGSGTIIGISSVAGERGRMSNYVYGSAKAGFSAYLSGLRNRLFHHGAHVMTVKPGFMATKMTEGMPLPKPLTAQPAQAGKAIYKGFRKKKNIIYVLGRWKWVMLIIKNIPEGIFKKLKL